MIVVDSSVLIAFFKQHETPATLRLRDRIDANAVLIGDIVLLEVLRGARDERHGSRLERWLSRFDQTPMLDIGLARKAAAHYRRLRSLGFTVRKTPDLVIGTFCIERGHRLLHNDRDFDPMVEHLGLRLA